MFIGCMIANLHIILNIKKNLKTFNTKNNVRITSTEFLLLTIKSKVG